MMWTDGATVGLAPPLWLWEVADVHLRHYHGLPAGAEAGTDWQGVHDSLHAQGGGVAGSPEHVHA
jgi:hypothetical protein